MRDIVLVTVDSLRADHVGWHGYERDTTPNLDELAADGRVFSNAFAHACSTRPSFPSILTSSYALAHGGFERLADERTTLAEILSDGGYRTGGFHSNLYLSADFGYDRGFSTFFDSRTDPSVTAKARNFVKRTLDSDGLLYRTLQAAFDATEKHAGVEVGSAYVEAAELTDRALKWVRNGDDGVPQFLWVHYMDVHHPYVPPAEHQRRFRDEAVPEREAVQLRRKMLESPDELSGEEQATILDLYDAEIAYVDSQVERLLKGIRWARGEVPVVAFTADHGEAFGEHGGYSHGATFYDEVLHVPLVLADGDGSERIDDLVGLLDLAPTLVDCAGLEQPAAFEGTSLLADDFSRSDVVAEWADTDPEADARRFAIRSADWKYVRMEGGAERLFDLTADPEERTNLVDDEPAVAADFRGRLEAHRERLAAADGDVGTVEMDDDVAERLRLLGYQE